ncbi:MAG: DUF305 domain-containing protein [Gaiellales bacterium]
MRTRSALLALLLIPVGLLAAGCGSDSLHDAMGHDGAGLSHDGMMGDDDGGATTHSAAQMGTGRHADVMFTQQMIPHHQQAVEMADLALDPAHAASPAVQDLARRIKAAQTAEIAMMNGWLRAWGADPASGHMDHGAMGMMSGADMTTLEDATGAAFDRLWLEGMIAHHAGALMMASHIADRGADPRVQKLAGAIDQSQAAEIAEMKKLLAQ